MAGNKLYLEPILSEFLDPLNENIDELIPIINAQVNDINICTCEETDTDVEIVNITNSKTGSFDFTDPAVNTWYFNFGSNKTVKFVSFCTGTLKAKLNLKVYCNQSFTAQMNYALCAFDMENQAANAIIDLQGDSAFPTPYAANTVIDYTATITMNVKAGHQYFIDTGICNRGTAQSGTFGFYTTLDTTKDNYMWFKRYDIIENDPIIF